MQELREKVEIFESLLASMTDLAATVPWKETTEASTQELHETISFHRQYREAVGKASDCLREIEQKLAEKESQDNGLPNRSFFEVRAGYFWDHTPGKYRRFIIRVQSVTFLACRRFS